jgi:glycosyltransferase involved in cell wall biosynthesis
MAAGVPPVVSNIPGNRDVVENGHTGVVVAVDDVAALASALARVLTDAGLRSALGAAARRTTDDIYSLDRVAARYRAIYAALRTGAPVPTPVVAGGVGKEDL